jgi:hypothetical protein
MLEFEKRKGNEIYSLERSRQQVTGHEKIIVKDAFVGNQ